MSLMRWDPFSMFTRPGAPNGDGALMAFDWAPTVDIVETETEFQVSAELPDVKKEDVKVTVDGGVLRIEGERKQASEEKGKKFHRVERSYGSFMRSFALPDNVDESKLRAEYKNGMLHVTVPKTEKPKPRSVEVKVN